MLERADFLAAQAGLEAVLVAGRNRRARDHVDRVIVDHADAGNAAVGRRHDIVDRCGLAVAGHQEAGLLGGGGGQRGTRRGRIFGHRRRGGEQGGNKQGGFDGHGGIYLW